MVYQSDEKHLLDSWKQQRAFRVHTALARYGIVFAIIATIIDLYFKMPRIVLAGDIALILGTAYTLLKTHQNKNQTKPRSDWAWAPLYIGLWISIVTSLMVTGGMNSPFIGSYLTLLYVCALIIQVRIRPRYVTLFIFLNLIFWVLAETITPNGFSSFPPPLIFSFLINSVIICTLMICIYEFLRTEKTLADEIVKRYQELSVAQESLNREEIANATKSTFLANISHELRTPLGAILGYADLILEPALTETERKGFVETIRSNGHQLLHLVDDLLDMTKVEAGKVEIEKLDFDPKQTIIDVIDLLTLSATKKSLGLSFIIRGELPQLVNSDPLRFRQILMNVIGNAIKFSERGQIQVFVEYEINEYFNSPQLVVDIQDTGPGLTLDEQDRLFKPFGQADPSITRKYGGSGLGLNLSRQLARLLGGDLQLEWSQSDVGSRFSLKLPARAKTITGVLKAPVPNQQKVKVQIPPGKTVLVVEDNPDNQTLIARYLKAAGLKVDIANDGLEAVQRMSQQTFDIIIMDVQMPILDGLQATHLLRQKSFILPIIALTAHAMKEDRLRCLDAGFNDYLTKPIDREILLEKIAFHLKKDFSEPKLTI